MDFLRSIGLRLITIELINFFIRCLRAHQAWVGVTPSPGKKTQHLAFLGSPLGSSGFSPLGSIEDG